MRVRRSSSALLLAVAAALLPTAPAAAAVTDYVGKPIVSVRLLVEGREVADPTLADVLETRTGEALSMAAVRESVTHLFSLGRFEDVRVDAALENGRVALRYELRPIHPVARIEFAGDVKAPGIDVGQLRRAVVDRYGSTPAVGRAADMSRTIEEALHEVGYLHPTVTPRPVLAHDPDRATLVFTLAAGARTVIDGVEMIGPSGVASPELLKQLRVAQGQPYEHDALADGIEKFIEARRRRGYFEAKVTPTVRLGDGDRSAHITLAVDLGPHVRVAFAGDPLPSDKRAELVPVEREGSADEDLLEDSSNRIEEYFRAQGYRDATAPYTRDESPGELLITFTIHKGRLYRLDHLDVSGNVSVPLADFAPLLREHDGEPFSSAKLDADAAAIEDVYRRRGFPSARAQSAVDVPPADDAASPVPVTVRIVVSEGPRTIVGIVTIDGNQAISTADLRARMRLQGGSPYFAAQLTADRDAIVQAYQNRGYESVTVEAAARYNADRTQVDPLFTVREGPQIFVDHVLIVGNVRTSTETIERALTIKSGDPLSAAAVSESQARLASLGLFRRSTITELRHGGENRRDLLVTVEEAAATTIGYGGGFEVQQVVSNDQNGLAETRLEFAPRASFELGRRNLFGKNRSANLFASVAEHIGGLPTEYQLLATYREPRLFDTSADAFVTGTIEQVHRTSFDFRQKSAAATIARHLTRTVSASAGYQLQTTAIFDEHLTTASDQSLLDRLFPNVLLSSFSGSLIRDTRSDPVDPHDGDYFSGNTQIAGRAIGSAVGFAKTFVTAEAFRTLPRTRGIVFAGDVRVGFATGFPQTDAAGNVISDLPQSERFYAGGDTTVRGFVLDTLGVHHIPAQPNDTIDENGFPKGGNGLVILNGELRAPVRGGLGLVGFVDTGNVFARATDIDLGLLRTAAGFGIRYKSPIGPLRFDIGFKLHRDVIDLAGHREALTAIHISLGQAF